MPVNFGKTFSSALRYALSLKRILPFFLINLIVAAFVFVFIDYAVDILPMVISGSFTSIPITTLIYATLAFVAIIGVTALLRIYVQAAITDNAASYWQKKRKKLTKSFPGSRKYITVLLALVLAGVISSIITAVLAYIPTAGNFLSALASILFGLIFLFIIQIVVISNKGVVDSIKAGYALFMKSKLDVLVFWIVLVILSIIIALVAIIPIAVALIPVIGLLAESLIVPGASTAAILGDIIPLIKANMLSIAVASIITSFIIAYLSVFQEAAKTFFYLQKKKR